jgi:hypothetical protein
VNAAEIGARIVLALLDDRAADRAVWEKWSNSAAPSPTRIAFCSPIRSSVKRWSMSSTASRLFRNTSRHIVGSDAAMRVKSRKPPAEYLMTSLCVTASRSDAVPTMV